MVQGGHTPLKQTRTAVCSDDPRETTDLLTSLIDSSPTGLRHTLNILGTVVTALMVTDNSIRVYLPFTINPERHDFHLLPTCVGVLQSLHRCFEKSV